jgi:hypothetical protein
VRKLILIVALTSLPTAVRADVGVFAGVDWRAMYAADHLSHGPGVQAGIILFDGHLKLGITGFARPGPINPATFEATLAQPYKGQSTVSLRSDGAMFGVFVAPVFAIPGTPLSLELPVALHQGGYGFYLTGQDRTTPDGRRVSAWENELFEGRDSSIGLGIEAGLRVALRLTDAPWLQPYLGVSYSTVLGFDTVVKSSYDGVAVALGVQVGTF